MLDYSSNMDIPEARSSGCLVNIDKGLFLLFGGGNRVTTFHDFWSLRIVHKTEGILYKWRKLENNYEMAPRFGSAINYIPAKNTLFIHGGQNFMINECYSDLYKILLNVTFPETENKNSSPTIKIESIKNLTVYPIDHFKTPVERNSHSSVLDIETGSIYIFGGANTSGLLNDLWEFKIESSKWEKIENKGEAPSIREMHGSVLYRNSSKSKYLFVFGGRLLDNISNEVFTFNLENKVWEKYCTMPFTISSFTTSLIKQYIVIYGGTNCIEFYNNIFLLNIETKKWYKSKFSPPEQEIGLGGRIASMSSFDEEHYIIYGGSGFNKESNDVYAVKIEELIDPNNLIQI